MKKIFFTILILILFCFSVSCFSQESKWGCGINLSLGGILSNKHWNGYQVRRNEEASVSGGIEINYKISENTYLTCGLEIIKVYHIEEDKQIIKFNNERTDNFLFMNIPFTINYKIKLRESSRNYLVIGIGPSLNITLDPDKYMFHSGEWSDYEEAGSYYDIRKQELSGKSKIKGFNIGVQPIIMYHFKRVSAGIEANIGLIDMNKSYGVKTGKRFICHIWPTVSYHF